MALDKKIEPQSRWIIILRWLFFLPAAVLISSFLSTLLFFINSISLGPYGPETDSLYFKICLTFFINMFQGGVFVYVGSRIAPYHRKIVAYSLTMAIVLVSGGMLSVALIQKDWLGAIIPIAGTMGAGLFAYQIAEGEFNLDTDLSNKKIKKNQNL